MGCFVDRSDISVSTGAFAELSLAAALEKIAELASSAEICSWGLHSLIQRDNARAAAATGLPFSVHAPPTYGHRMHTRAARRAALETHRRQMELAAELGARLYVVHPDLQTRPGRWNHRVAAALERSLAELRILRDELGLPVAVENLFPANRSHFTTPGDIDLQGLGLTLDVGHAALTGTLAQWLQDPHADLYHVHLHDNKGAQSGDSHDPLGSGIIDVAPVFAAARAVGATLVLEHVSEDDVLASIAHLRRQGLLAPPVG
jgi:sugar phosphate isomerase/epimerase